MKRGDTQLSPPEGVCEYCGTDTPGGSLSYQRWSRVQIRVVDQCNIIRSFVCCRSCYTVSLPSHNGSAKLDEDGELVIIRGSGKPLSRTPKNTVSYCCIGYKDEKIHFAARDSNVVMKQYWQAGHKKRKVAELSPPPAAVAYVSK